MIDEMNIYLSSSWKNRDRVRALATKLRESGHEVYDFTDKDCRPEAIEIPPEAFPEQFDPAKHNYREYLHRNPEWKKAVLANRDAIRLCDVVVLMLPCGNDAHADAFYGFGRGKYVLVCGQPRAGERTPTHMWLPTMLDTDDDVVPFINTKLPHRLRTGDVVDHQPTGERWTVAYAQGDEVIPCGWPLTFAKINDCLVVERVSDEKRHKLLLEMKAMSDGSDPRCRYATSILAEEALR